MDNPKIRFSNFNSTWYVTSLGKISDVITGGEAPQDFIKSKYSYRNYKYPIFSNGLGENALWGYSTSYKVNWPSITFSSIGTLGYPEVRNEPFTPIIRLKVITPKKPVNNVYYLKYNLDTVDFLNNYSGIPNLNANELKSIELSITDDCDEQNKIASFLSNIDSLIEEKKNELEKTKQYKEAMLYKMFPKEGFKVPEIRFKGFEGEWKTRVFEKAFDKLCNNSIKRDLLNYKKGIVKNIHYGDVLIKFGFTVNPSDMEVPYINEGEKVSKNAEDYLITGDVVFADTAEDTTAGKVTEIINQNGVKTLAGLHTYPCRPLGKYVPGFLGIMLNTSLFHNQLIPYMQGTKVTGFNYGQLCKTVIYYPGDEEQKKIVEFFDNLDSKIKNQEKEITILENYKATLLEKMFA